MRGSTTSRSVLQTPRRSSARTRSTPPSGTSYRTAHHKCVRMLFLFVSISSVVTLSVRHRVSRTRSDTPMRILWFDISHRCVQRSSADERTRVVVILQSVRLCKRPVQPSQWHQRTHSRVQAKLDGIQAHLSRRALVRITSPESFFVCLMGVDGPDHILRYAVKLFVFSSSSLCVD